MRVREQEEPTEEDAGTGQGWAGPTGSVQPGKGKSDLAQEWGLGRGSGADSGPGKSGDSPRTAVAWVFLEDFGCQSLMGCFCISSETGRGNEDIFFNKL